MKLFQTVQGEKKGIWHIICDEDSRRVSGICNGLGYWFNGYHGNKPDQKGPNRCEYSGEEKLCPSCVQTAYVRGLIKIQPTV